MSKITDLMTQGNQLLEQQQYSQAIELYNQCLQQDNNITSQILCKKGQCLNKLEQYEEALICYNQAIDTDPNNSELYLHKGDALDNLDKLDEALQCYDQGIKLNDQNPQLYSNKAFILYKLDQHQKALACYDKTIELDQTNIKAYLNKIIIYQDLKMYIEAVQTIDNAIQFNGNNAELYFSKGDIYDDLKRYDEAQVYYEKTIQTDPKFIDAYINLGRILETKQEFQKSLEQFQQVLEIEPQHEQAHFNQGAVYQNMGKYKESISSFEQVLQINSSNLDALYHKAVCLSLLEQKQEALDLLNQIIQQDLHENQSDENLINPLYQLNRVEVLYQLGHKQEALEALNKVQKQLQNHNFEEQNFRGITDGTIGHMKLNVNALLQDLDDFGKIQLNIENQILKQIENLYISQRIYNIKEDGNMNGNLISNCDSKDIYDMKKKLSIIEKDQSVYQVHQGFTYFLKQCYQMSVKLKEKQFDFNNDKFIIDYFIAMIPVIGNNIKTTKFMHKKLFQRQYNKNILNLAENNSQFTQFMEELSINAIFDCQSILKSQNNDLKIENFVDQIKIHFLEIIQECEEKSCIFKLQDYETNHILGQIYGMQFIQKFICNGSLYQQVNEKRYSDLNRKQKISLLIGKVKQIIQDKEDYQIQIDHDSQSSQSSCTCSIY